ncbi:MAG: hypothetical protein K2X35_09295 [Bryobacteraceae bacterium]|nr:hypothetical protein [Bryobacteraceae bacterium]
MRFSLAVWVLAASAIAQEPPKPADANPPRTKPQAAKPDAAKPAAGADYTIDGEFDVRFRWLSDLKGNENVYRSVVNLGEGVRLFNGAVRYSAPDSKVLDQLNIFANGWGGDPWTNTRVDGRRNGVYEFNIDYRNVAYFNNLPIFANPLLGNGVLFSQRAFDTRLRQVDAELRLFPSARISPFVSFSRGMQQGTGIVPFVGEGNEYPVGTEYDNAQNLVRGGVRIQGAKYNATLEGGWSDFYDDQSVGYFGPNNGNRLTPFFGRNLRLFSVQQRYNVEGDGPFLRALLQYRPSNWLSVNGQFTWVQPSIRATSQSDAAGSFFSRELGLPFNTFIENTTGRALRPFPSGLISAEFSPVRRVRVIQTFSTDRFNISQFANVRQQESGATPAAAVDNAIYNQRLFLNWNRFEILGIWEATSILSLRGGFRYTWGDAEAPAAVTPVASTNRGEIRLPAVLAGATLRFGSKWSGAFDFEGSQGDRQNFFRTSLLEYNKGRAQVRYRFSQALNINVLYSILDNRNPNPAIRLDTRIQNASAGLNWTPGDGQRVNFTGEYTYSSWRNNIDTITLPLFGRQTVLYRDFGHHANAFVDLRVVRQARLNLGGSFSINNGSLPTRLYQPVVGLSVPFYKKIGFIGDWRFFQYTTNQFRFQDFQRHAISAGLRIGF